MEWLIARAYSPGTAALVGCAWLAPRLLHLVRVTVWKVAPEEPVLSIRQQQPKPDLMILEI